MLRDLREARQREHATRAAASSALRACRDARCRLRVQSAIQAAAGEKAQNEEEQVDEVQVERDGAHDRVLRRKAVDDLGSIITKAPDAPAANGGVAGVGSQQALSRWSAILELVTKGKPSAAEPAKPAAEKPFRTLNSNTTANPNATAVNPKVYR